MYKLEKLSLDQVRYYDQIVLDYLEGKEALSPFYEYSPHPDEFEKAIQTVQSYFSTEKRETLQQVLSRQYNELETPEPVKDNIMALGEKNTFTITTGHQPAIFTGPLYFIYKIVSAINVAQKLNDQFEEYLFVPVYWLGGEDHDFDEVNSMTLFGKTLKWERKSGGPVGRMDTKSLEEVFPRLKEILGDGERDQQIYDLLQTSYLVQPDLDSATRWLLNQLFGEEGLIVLNPDDKELKRHFTLVMEDDIMNQTAHKLVNDTVQELKNVYKQNSYQPQARPRPVNIFYMTDDFRARIEQQNGDVKTVEQDVSFSKKELQQALKNKPQQFSPNVILRPVYQQTILPNLAYIGGGAEVSYWLELKAVFEHYDIPLPMILLRDSALWLDKVSAKRMQKLEIETSLLFREADQIVHRYVKSQMADEDPLQEEREELKELFDKITNKAASADQSLEGYVKARQKRVEKMLGNIHNRIKKAEKEREETAINQIYKMKEKLFPENNLQERVENFIPLYLQYGEEWFDILKEEFDPFDQSFKVFRPADGD